MKSLLRFYAQMAAGVLLLAVCGAQFAGHFWRELIVTPAGITLIIAALVLIQSV